MTVHFIVPPSNPPGKLAEAELHFDDTDSPLFGLKLIGFAIWERRGGGGRSVTFPARSYAINGERRSFALLRPIVDATAPERIRTLILDAYASHMTIAAQFNPVKVYSTIDTGGRYEVQVLEPGGFGHSDVWTRCVREDIQIVGAKNVLDGICDNTPAVFYTRAEAVAFVDALRGLMHCGGGDTQFRIVEIASGQVFDAETDDIAALLNDVQRYCPVSVQDHIRAALAKR